MWLDDGDCITFNMGYPICKVDGKSNTRFAYWINNGIDIDAHSSFSLVEKNPFVLEMVCDQAYNDKDCLYDGGDCGQMNANDNEDRVVHGGQIHVSKYQLARHLRYAS